jgi:hypothetical protein
MPEIERRKGDVFELETPGASARHQRTIGGCSPGSLASGREALSIEAHSR